MNLIQRRLAQLRWLRFDANPLISFSLSERRLMLGYLTTVSVAPEAMAAASSSVMSMARFITVGSLVFRVGALP